MTKQQQAMVNSLVKRSLARPIYVAPPAPSSASRDPQPQEGALSTMTPESAMATRHFSQALRLATLVTFGQEERFEIGAVLATLTSTASRRRAGYREALHTLQSKAWQGPDGKLYASQATIAQYVLPYAEHLTIA